MHQEICPYAFLPICLFACPPLPAPPNINIGLPRSTHLLHAHCLHVSPTFWAGKHGPVVHQCSRLPTSLGVATPSPSPPFPPHTYPYSIATTPRSSSPLFSMSRNPTANSFLAWDHDITTKTGTNTSLPDFPIPLTPCAVLPPGKCSLVHTGIVSCCWQHPRCPSSMPAPTEPSLWAGIFFISKILSN